MRICKHFNECGGCRFQDIPYKNQLKDKQQRVKKLLDDYEIETNLRGINHARNLYYRNKMEFTFADQGKIVCGLYSKNKRGRIVDLEECLIFSPDTGKILNRVREFVQSQSHSVHNCLIHKGFLRNLIIRETKFTKEIMIGLVTSSHQQLNTDEFVKGLLSLKLKSKIKSIYWIINNSLSDAVIFEKKNLLYGEQFIKEKLGNFIFKIAIDTFFQVNSRLVVKLYKKIANQAKRFPQSNTLDLFCGTGSIGTFLSSRAKHVWGVEISKEIIDMAKENAKINKIKNISFFVSDARLFLNTNTDFNERIDLVVVNPPRSGLSKKVIRAILRRNPKAIFYSSCNPQAFCRDLKEFTGEYTLDFVELFDFFPHTPHLECFGLLKRK